MKLNSKSLQWDMDCQPLMLQNSKIWLWSSISIKKGPCFKPKVNVCVKLVHVLQNQISKSKKMSPSCKIKILTDAKFIILFYIYTLICNQEWPVLSVYMKTLKLKTMVIDNYTSLAMCKKFQTK